MAPKISDMIWEAKSRMRWQFKKATGKADASYQIEGDRISLHSPHRGGSSTLTIDAEDLRTHLQRKDVSEHDVIFMSAELATKALAEYDAQQEALRKQREEQALKQAQRVKSLALRRR